MYNTETLLIPYRGAVVLQIIHCATSINRTFGDVSLVHPENGSLTDLALLVVSHGWAAVKVGPVDIFQPSKPAHFFPVKYYGCFMHEASLRYT